MNLIKRYPGLFVAGFFALVLVAFFGPIAFGRIIFLNDADVVVYYYPIFTFYSQALHAGESFLWLPSIYSGFPIYLSQVGGFFDPVNLLIFRFFSGISGVEMRLIIDVALTCVTSYLAARALGVSRYAAMLVGPSYLLAFHWRYLSNPLTASTLFLLPLLLLCAVRMIRNETLFWRYVLLAGIGIGWSILSGYTQLVVYALLIVGLFVLLQLFYFDGPTNLRRFCKVIGAWIIATVIGVVVGLPQILPAAKFLPSTSRGEEATYHELTLKVIDPGDAILALVPPYFYVPYVTAGRKPLFVGSLLALLGVGVLLVVGMNALRSRSIRSLAGHDRTIAAIGVLFLFAFFAAIKWSPIFFLLSKLPVIGLFRFPFRFMFLGAFLLALLGAFGLDRAAEVAKERVFKMALYVVAAVAAMFSGGLVIFGMLGSYVPTLFGRIVERLFTTAGFAQNRVDHYSDAVNRGVAAYRELLNLSEPSVAIPLALLIASIVLLLLFVHGKRSVAQFQAQACMLIVCTIFGVTIAGWGNVFSSSPTLGADNILNPLVTIEEATQYRFYSFMPSLAIQKVIPPQYKLSREEDDATVELLAKAGSPNMHLFSRFSSVDGYDQFEPSGTLTALERIGGELGAGYGSGTNEERKERLLDRVDILSMMGGRYVLSGVPLESSALSLLATTSVSSYGMVIYSYLNEKASPLYYFAPSVVPSSHQSFEELVAHEGLRFNEAVYLDCADCKGVSGRGSIKEVRSANGLHLFETITASQQFLVLSETYLPGWEVSVDGARAPLIRANGLYMAVAVPEGAHRIRFEYRGMFNELSILKRLGIVNDDY